MLLAGDSSGIYPCHVSPGQMRQHPIGTGPFKFVEFKPNEDIQVTRNPDYWKPGRPYLDGIEYTIIKDPGTANLAFIAGKFDMTFPYFGLTIPLMKNRDRIGSSAPIPDRPGLTPEQQSSTQSGRSNEPIKFEPAALPAPMLTELKFKWPTCLHGLSRA
jgi:ABC-type transport system substrate-binding protein